MEENYGSVERPVPYNLAAEQAVLASLLIERDSVIKVAPFLHAEHFYNSRYGDIYAAVLALYERRVPPDPVTVHAELHNRGLGIDIQLSDIVKLSESRGTAVHVEYYGHIVEHKAVLRKLISAGGEIAALGYKEDEDVEDVLSEASTILLTVGADNRGDGYATMEQVMVDLLNEMDAMQESGGHVPGVPTGLPDMDSMSGGLHPGDLIILAARPGWGKTSLALCIGLNAANVGKHVGVFSLEMGRAGLGFRLLAVETGIDSKRIQLGYLSEQERSKVADAVGRLAQLPIFIDEKASQRVQELRARAFRMKAEQGLDLLIVDYLQLIESNPKASNRTEAVGEISRQLKLLATALRIPVIACAQLNRQVENRSGNREQLSDLRESGSIEQDADIVWFIHNDRMRSDGKGEPGVVEIIWAKHRNGKLGDVPLWFDPRTTKFSGMDYGHELVRVEYEEELGGWRD